MAMASSATVEYDIKLLLGDNKDPIDRRIEMRVPDKHTSPVTYLDLLRANERAIGGVFRRLRTKGAITLIINFKGMKKELNIPFANAVDLEKNGHAYSLVLELTDKEDDEDYDCYVWGQQEDGTNAERTATSSGDVCGTVHGATASGRSLAHNAPTTSLSSGPSTASGSGAVGHIQTHNVTINVREKEASSSPFRKGSDSGVSDDVQLGESDDRIPFTEVVSHIGQAKWKDICFTLGFAFHELDDREKSRPYNSGKEKLLHFLHEVISDKGYAEARKKIIAACKKAKLRGALIDTLAKNGLTL